MWEKIPKSSSSSTTNNSNVVAVLLCREIKLKVKTFDRKITSAKLWKRKNVRKYMNENQWLRVFCTKVSRLK